MNKGALVALEGNRRDFTREEMEPRVARLFRRLEESNGLQYIQRLCQRDQMAMVIQISAQSVRDNLSDGDFNVLIVGHCTFHPRADLKKLYSVDEVPENAMWVMCF